MTTDALNRIIRAINKEPFTVMSKWVRVSLPGLRTHDVSWALIHDTVRFSSTVAADDSFETDRARVEYIASQNAGMPGVRAVIEGGRVKAYCDLPAIGLTKTELESAILLCAREADRMEMGLTGEDEF